ncbi:MAG: hypothetical protein Q9159_000871 [Coniocarpon cinnabarinum]
MPSFPPASHAGNLHHYASRLVAFEHGLPHGNAAAAHNFVLFVGGLDDSLLTVRYPSVLATVLPASWAVAEVQTRSSGVGFATGSLERDSEDLVKAVAYFRQLAKQRNAGASSKVVLIGHSTGCQDAMNYLIGPWKQNPIPGDVKQRPVLDGVVFQAGISDREAVEGRLPPQLIRDSLDLARAMVDQGKGRDQLPIESTNGMFGAQPSANRWLSLISDGGDDDYFSSDLPDDRVERVWGSEGLATRGVKTLVLLGEKDDGMPQRVDKAELIGRWETYVKGSNGLWDDRSGVLPGAGHNLNDNSDDVVRTLCERIAGFVRSLDPELAQTDVGKL